MKISGTKSISPSITLGAQDHRNLDLATQGIHEGHEGNRRIYDTAARIAKQSGNAVTIYASKKEGGYVVNVIHPN